jgi:hypothetical protein
MPQPVSYRRLTTGRKIAIKAMLDSGFPERQIAALENVSPATVNNIRHDPELQDLSPSIVEKTKSMLASRAYVMADRSISKAAEEDRLDKMNSYQLTVMGSIMIDKARLMEGMSTENLALHSVSEHLKNGANELDNMKSLIIKRFRMSLNEDNAISDGNASKTNDSHTV